MGEPKHTPAPWIARGCELVGAGTLIATIHWHSGRKAENEADTRLIAAAPALLEALIVAQDQLRRASDQFAFYADEHAKKGTPEGDAKGMTNMGWARSLAHTDHAARAAIDLATKDQSHG